MTKAKSKKAKRDYEGDLVAGLIELMEQGTNPWQKDWDGCKYGTAHRNLINGHIYRGSNPALLELQMNIRGVDMPLWVPRGAGIAKGWWPRKGSQSACIVMPFTFDKEKKDADGKPIINPETGEAETEKGMGFSYKGGIFNAMDLEGRDVYGPDRKVKITAAEAQASLDKAIAAEMRGTDEVRPEPERHDAAEAVLGNWQVPVQWRGDRAFYSPTGDFISLPARDSFHTSAGLYSTWAHEAVHSTGHESRLKRDGIVNFGGFGCESYAKEELVAELGAFLLCTRMEISSRVDNHASYLHHWIKCLKEEPRFLKTALSAAKKAANTILPETIEENKPEAQAQSKELIPA